MIGCSKDKNHLIRFGKGCKSRPSVNIKVRIISVVVNLLCLILTFLLYFYSQTNNLTFLIDENSNLIAIFISDQLSTFYTNMLLTIELNINIVSRKANGTTKSYNKYQSPIFGLTYSICLLFLTFNFD